MNETQLYKNADLFRGKTRVIRSAYREYDKCKDYLNR